MKKLCELYAYTFPIDVQLIFYHPAFAQVLQDCTLHNALFTLVADTADKNFSCRCNVCRGVFLCVSATKTVFFTQHTCRSDIVIDKSASVNST